MSEGDHSLHTLEHRSALMQAYTDADKSSKQNQHSSLLLDCRRNMTSHLIVPTPSSHPCHPIALPLHHHNQEAHCVLHLFPMRKLRYHVTQWHRKSYSLWLVPISICEAEAERPPV